MKNIDIDKQLTAAKKELSELRGQLPGPAMPRPEAWYTLDEAADLLGISAREAEARLAPTGLMVDGKNRRCISRADFDNYVISAASGLPRNLITGFGG